MPESYWKQVHREVTIGPLVAIKTPLGGVDYLKNHPGGKLFNPMGYGSYLIWALPEQGVFIDPRVELYSYEQWQDYIRVSHAARYSDILDHYGVDRLLLDREEQHELVLALKTDSAWALEYEDEQSQIWAQR